MPGVTTGHLLGVQLDAFLMHLARKQGHWGIKLEKGNPVTCSQNARYRSKGGMCIVSKAFHSVFQSVGKIGGTVKFLNKS